MNNNFIPYPGNNPYSYNPTRMSNNNGIVWVQGVEGAKAYQLMPNSNAMLMDSENDNIFYIKVSDNVGMCTLRTFRYEEITSTPTNSVDLSKYITREEFENVIGGLKNEQPISSAKSNNTKSSKSVQSDI